MSGLHVALVMDGTARWSDERSLPRWRGHLAAAQAVKPIIDAAPGLGIDSLTLYAFSSADWDRPATEIRHILLLIEQFGLAEGQALRDAGIRVSVIGRRGRIPSRTASVLDALERMTARGTQLHVRFAVDYSARYAITRAVAQAAQSPPETIDAGTISECIQRGAAPLDFLVRTGGQRRISDFLLWEIAYAELYFTETLWPEFTPAHLAHALTNFHRRDRRFGGLSAGRTSLLPGRLAG